MNRRSVCVLKILAAFLSGCGDRIAERGSRFGSMEVHVPGWAWEMT